MANFDCQLGEYIYRCMFLNGHFCKSVKRSLNVFAKAQIDKSIFQAIMAMAFSLFIYLFIFFFLLFFFL